MIEAINLSKKFIKTEKKSRKIEFCAVNHISLRVMPGEILGILGPNGAGKTTLLRMLGTLMQPTEGTVSITDSEKQTIKDPLELKRHIGYLSGNTKLYGRFTTREFLALLGEAYGYPKDFTDERIEKINQLINMHDFIDNRIEKLSTGQTQRASIARCLIHDPDIYIFDEPTLGLDIISSHSIIEFMKKEKEQGKSVLYSTHYMEEAEYLCDRIIMIHEGNIIAEGTPLELRTRTNTTNLRDTFMSLIANVEQKEGETL